MTGTDDTARFYNDLALSFEEAARIVEAGAQERRAAAHTPVVATLDKDGDPSQRVMILRAVDWTNRTLRFHTDFRAAKASEADGGATSVLFYEPDAKVQIRFGGVGRTEHHSATADAAWEGSTLFARRCYMAEAAPGAVSLQPVSGLPERIKGKQPTTEDIIPARANFAILLVKFDTIEWLYLANSGHRRARWNWDGADWSGSWLVP
jgi:pyridoxamine 5'-phosphate oxidase